MKKPLYRNAMFLGIALVLPGLLWSCTQMSVSLEPQNSEVTTSTLPPHNSTPSVYARPASETTSKSSNHKLVYNPTSTDKVGSKGNLRMSNQTYQPVRLALLARGSSTKSSAGKQAQLLPAHWDFAPQEGSEKGLLLSLPNGKLALFEGDILVAFAQDGSRRYWGPYVVGETSVPVWDAKAKEWQLILSSPKSIVQSQ